jgi:hypothetical protein
MKYVGNIVGIVFAVGLLGACVAPVEKKDYTQFREENLRSILIVPVVNSTVNVDAAAYFLSTIAAPIAERGYYAFPINLVKQVMEEDGLADANMVHAADPTRLGELFGADAILYISIEHWETTYVILSATTTVSFTYVLKSGRSGEELWRESSTLRYTPNSGGGGSPLAMLIVMVVQAAIQKAAPNYIPLAKQANAMAIWTPSRGLPAGPYHKLYGKDLDKF